MRLPRTSQAESRSGGFTLTSSPTFRNCGFCGQDALYTTANTKVQANNNYYGDAEGPQINNAIGFLLGGSRILGVFDTQGSFLPTGP